MLQSGHRMRNQTFAAALKFNSEKYQVKSIIKLLILKLNE